VGLSRSPDKLGKHNRYIPRSIDIEKSNVPDLAKAFQDCQVLVSEYGPHTEGADALQYMPYLEVIRKVVLSVKLAKIEYFVMVGGTGSLHVPGAQVGQCVVDDTDFFLAYRRGLADSHAHVTYMEERLGPMGSALRVYRDARIALAEGRSTPDSTAAIEEYEKNVRTKDRASDFIKAGRTSFLFFDGNESFPWTFVSPSALYRPGKRTGQYRIVLDDLPLKDTPSRSSNPLDGRLLGISCADLAVAITDEIETQKHKSRHWTAVGDLSDDTPAPSYLTLAMVADGSCQ